MKNNERNTVGHQRGNWAQQQQEQEEQQENTNPKLSPAPGAHFSRATSYARQARHGHEHGRRFPGCASVFPQTPMETTQRRVGAVPSLASPASSGHLQYNHISRSLHTACSCTCLCILRHIRTRVQYLELVVNDALHPKISTHACMFPQSPTFGVAVLRRQVRSRADRLVLVDVVSVQLTAVDGALTDFYFSSPSSLMMRSACRISGSYPKTC